MSFKVVIPARYASVRLPGKPLLDIAGQPMIQWVIAAALRSQADEVLVATDDERIASAVVAQNGAKARAVMTRPDHVSGTDRIAEVADVCRWNESTIVVNVQGDEPQIPPELIDQVASLLDRQPDADIATLCTPITSVRELLDPNVVKVVMGEGGRALYFSRAPIPWHRDGVPHGQSNQANFSGAYRHLGIYAYRVASLVHLSALPPSELESIEKLEQLRALQAGMDLLVEVAVSPPRPGVDTLEDLERARISLGETA